MIFHGVGNELRELREFHAALYTHQPKSGPGVGLTVQGMVLD